MNIDLDTDHVHADLDRQVLTVRLDRPAKKNALTQAMYRALADALDIASNNDDTVRVILLTASGEAFTAGNDINDFAAPTEGTGEPPVARFLRTLTTAQVPVVAAVNGLAVGIGVTMLLHCDLVYASRTAAFQLPFVTLGLVPEAASSLLLPLLVGRTRAAELLLTGRRFDAAEATDHGLVLAAVEPEDLLPTAETVALQVAGLPPAAVRRTKALLISNAVTVAERMHEEGRHFAAQLTSDEFRSTVQALTKPRGTSDLAPADENSSAPAR